MCQHFTKINLLIAQNDLWCVKCFYPHFTDWQTEIHGGKGCCFVLMLGRAVLGL